MKRHLRPCGLVARRFRADDGPVACARLAIPALIANFIASSYLESETWKQRFTCKLDQQLRPSPDYSIFSVARTPDNLWRNGESGTMLFSNREVVRQPERLHQLWSPHGDLPAPNGSKVVRRRGIFTEVKSPAPNARTRCIFRDQRKYLTDKAAQKQTGESELCLSPRLKIGRYAKSLRRGRISFHGRVHGHVCRERHAIAAAEKAVSECR